MKRLRAKALPVLCLLCVCVLLKGCAAREAGAEETLNAVLSFLGDSPTGTVYLSEAEEGNAAYLSRENFDLLYGAGAYDDLYPTVREYALYLSSFATPFEVAIFRCYGSTDAKRVGQMLLLRADALKVNLKRCGLYETYGETVRVTVKGRYALLVMAGIPVSERELCRLL